MSQMEVKYPIPEVITRMASLEAPPPPKGEEKQEEDEKMDEEEDNLLQRLPMSKRLTPCPRRSIPWTIQGRRRKVSVAYRDALSQNGYGREEAGSDAVLALTTTRISATNLQNYFRATGKQAKQKSPNALTTSRGCSNITSQITTR